MKVSLIAAIDRNGLIADDKGLPWAGRMPSDMVYFRAITIGHTIIMGRTTFEEFDKLLPGRDHIVITSKKLPKQPGLTVVKSPEDALTTVEDEGEVFVIGGAMVFSEFIDKAKKLYLTEIDHEFKGNKYFPKFKKSEWKETNRHCYKSDDRNAYNYCFVTYERHQ